MTLTPYAALSSHRPGVKNIRVETGGGGIALTGSLLITGNVSTVEPALREPTRYLKEVRI
jgi:ethanolamine utilization microcompartment shell protein EutS